MEARMFGMLTLKKIPLYYEIIFNKEKLSIVFSLCPEANNFFLEKTQQKSVMAKHLEEKIKLPSFILPVRNKWGFGAAFSKVDCGLAEKEWVSWECVLPKRANNRALDKIAASISYIVTILHLFHFENEDAGSQTRRQLMTIDGMVIEHHNHFNGGNFSFSFSRPVLEFCERIWESGNDYHEDIINTMIAVWLRLAGRKKIKSFEKRDFRINYCQDDKRLISLSCPGNCA